MDLSKYRYKEDTHKTRRRRYLKLEICKHHDTHEAMKSIDYSLFCLFPSIMRFKGKILLDHPAMNGRRAATETGRFIKLSRRQTTPSEVSLTALDMGKTEQRKQSLFVSETETDLQLPFSFVPLKSTHSPSIL